MPRPSRILSNSCTSYGMRVGGTNCQNHRCSGYARGGRRSRGRSGWLAEHLVAAAERHSEAERATAHGPPPWRGPRRRPVTCESGEEYDESTLVPSELRARDGACGHDELLAEQRVLPRRSRCEPPRNTRRGGTPEGVGLAPPGTSQEPLRNTRRGGRPRVVDQKLLA